MESGFLESGFRDSGFLDSRFLDFGFLDSGFLDSGFTGFLDSGIFSPKTVQFGLEPLQYWHSELSVGFPPVAPEQTN